MASLTDMDCKRILSKLGFKYGVSPRLIASRLLDDLDKDSMREGVLEISSLSTFVEVWRDNGKPDVAHGSTEPMQIVPLPITTKEQKDNH